MNFMFLCVFDYGTFLLRISRFIRWYRSFLLNVTLKIRQFSPNLLPLQVFL